MLKDFELLNEAQKSAVMDESDYLRIIAGAGSGKTRVLTMRIAHLIEDLKIKPYHILAITFTNKAAREMKERIGKMLDEDRQNVWISTIHSLCMRILREDIGALGYPKNFTIIDQNDQNQILKEAYKEYGIEKKNLSYGSVLSYISNNKYAQISPERAKKMAYGELSEENKAKVYAYYMERLSKMYALDFDDLIIFTVELFDKDADIKTKWSSRFHYIHVDEFQDIDKLQYKLITQLASVHKRIYVVGDPDQTIYTWRGADVNIIINFEKDFPNTKTIILNQNYRSTANILNGANSLIRNNKLRVKKDLLAVNGDGSKIYHKTLSSDEMEAYYVKNTIMNLRHDGENYRDIAVLYRSNYLSRNIEKSLVESQIPYVITGGIRFYERAEIKDILSYLRMITTGDDLAFSRIINVPKRGIGAKTIETILSEARKMDMTMYDYVKAGLYPKNKAVFESFVKMVEKWRQRLDDSNLELLLKDVLDESGYRAYLISENETERLENVKSLVDDISEYQKTYPESNLNEYLQMIALYTEKEGGQEVDAVNLMTIHSSKGLEFDNVFVIGMSEGVFPSERSVSDGLKGLEEERRLAYVAYTRAKKKLYLTDSNDFSYVVQHSKTTSRFVKEIDEEFVDNGEVKVKTVFEEEKANVNKNVKPNNFKKGDKVYHDMFKNGVIIKIDGIVMTVAFESPFGIKKIVKNHPSIRKA